MSLRPTSTAVAEPIQNNGLSFNNEHWNHTIQNGQLLSLSWNRSIRGIEADLGLFKVSYLGEGVTAYRLKTNLTDLLGDKTARWTPEGLSEELYVFWLQTIGQEQDRWAISPPWMPKPPAKHGSHWAVPIGIPLAGILGIYVTCLIIGLLCHRRKKARRRRRDIHQQQRRERRAMLAAQAERRQQQLQDEEEQPLDPHADRFPSVSSSASTEPTLQGDEDDADVKLPGLALVAESPRRSAAGQRPSVPDLYLDLATPKRQFTFEGTDDELSPGRRPSVPEDVYDDARRGRGRTSIPGDAHADVVSRARRRPSIPGEVYWDAAGRRRQPPAELYADTLPASEVGRAL